MKNVAFFIQKFLLLGNLGMNNRGKSEIPSRGLVLCPSGHVCGSYFGREEQPV